MDDAELARLEQENLIEATASATANAREAMNRHDRGVALIVSRLPARIFNQILIESADADPAAVADAVATARERGDRFVVNLRVGTDDQFIARMPDMGLIPISNKPWMPGMALEPIPDGDGSTLPDYEIVQVAGEAQLDDHIAVTTAGFEMPEFMVREIVTAKMLQRPGVTLYTGYLNGRPISTGVGVRTGNTMGLYNISTVPDARGRGYGGSITERVALDGGKAGCNVAVLQASPMGFPIYQRLGYRTVVDYMGYIDPPTAS